MSTAVIIAIAVVALIVIIMLASRGRVNERRREAASGLRREASDREEKALEAEVAARDQRELADSRRARADRIDPDSDGRERASEDETASTDDDDDDDERPGLRDRLTGR